MSRRYRVTVTIVLLIGMASAALSDEAKQSDEPAQIVRQTKDALLLLKGPRHGLFGTAFCIESSGLFVVSRGLVNLKVGSELILIRHPDEPDMTQIRARIIRSEPKSQFVLLEADVKDFPSIPLGDDQTLFETMVVTAYGFPAFPAGRLLANDTRYPSVTVTAASISALRKSNGSLQTINFGNGRTANLWGHGGPVVDGEGKVIGVLYTSKVGGPTSAIPVTELKKALQSPVISFQTTSLDEADSHTKRQFTAIVRSLDKPMKDRRVKMEFRSDHSEPRQFDAISLDERKFVVDAELVPQSPSLVNVDVEFPSGTVRGRIVDRQVKVGNDSVSLSQIRRIDFGPNGAPPDVVLENQTRHDGVAGLEKFEIELGGANTTINLDRAIRLSVEPIPALVSDVEYRVIVLERDEIISETSGRITIIPTQLVPADAMIPANSASQEDVENSAKVAPANVPPETQPEPSVKPPVSIIGPPPPVVLPPLTPPELGSVPKIVQIPTAIDEIVVGAGGRLLCLHLKKYQQMAIFDVSQAKLIKVLPLASNDITYAAGASKLFVGYRDLKRIQRYDLTTLERETVVSAPEGGIGTLAIGARATAPLILLASRDAKRSYQIDPVSLQAEPFAWHGWGGGAAGPDRIHLSLDGSTAVACGGSWGGIEVATFAEGKVISRKSGSFVMGHTFVAGNGELVFPFEGGILSPDLVNAIKGIDGVPFPAVDFDYSLALSKDNALILFNNNDPKPLVMLRDIPEIGHGAVLPLPQRILLIPKAKVLVTVGEGRNRLVLRRFDLNEALEKEGIDYLFVESTPLRVATRGIAYRYPIQVRSRKGQVKFSLTAGPEGMTISNDGVVDWNVTESELGKEATVAVQITDASEQQASHTFKIAIK